MVRLIVDEMYNRVGRPGKCALNPSAGRERMMNELPSDGIGRAAVVVGAGTSGPETTEILNEGGSHVTVIEMAREIAPGTWFQLIDDEMSRIEKFDTEFKDGLRLTEINDEGAVVEDVKSRKLSAIPADEAVLSLGIRSVNSIIKEPEGRFPHVLAVGDADKSGQIGYAVQSVFNTVMSIK